jgi:glycosyltransferase involved in cell wall biosynthesis
MLHFEGKIGKGGAIITGFKVAKGSIIGFVDADESVEPEDVAKMCDMISNFDGVIASRRLRESKILVEQPLPRRIMSIGFNIVVKVLFGLNIKDTQCGAKVFKKEALISILDKLNTKGFEFDVELLWRLKKRHYKVLEFPITWKHSKGSRLGLWEAPGMFFSLLKVRLWN